MQLTPRSAKCAVVTASLFLVCGCYRRPSTSFERAALVGAYVYRSAAGPPIHSPDRLTLRADGTYVLVHMPGGRPGRTDLGTWRFVRGSHPHVLVGRAGYPVRIKGRRVRLLIDLDLGYWYQKIDGTPSRPTGTPARG
jgi:hypothetical protein